MTVETELVRHPLGYVRRLRGWSPGALLDAVADVARDEFGVRVGRRDRAKVLRWEAGEAEPAPAAQRALAYLLDVPVERLASHPWPRWLPAYQGLSPVRGWSPTSALVALDDVVRGEPGDQRGYPGIEGLALVALAAGWPGAAPGALTAVVRGALHVGEEVIGRTERQAEVLRRLDDRLAAGTVTAVAAAQLTLLAELLGAGTYPAPVARRLLLAAADLAQLAGWTALEQGRHFAAQRCLRAALYAAHTAGEPSLAAYLLICLAHQALRRGQPATAVQVAEAAVSGAAVSGAAVSGTTVTGVRSPRARALLAGHLAAIRIAAGESVAAPARLDVTPRHTDPAWTAWGDVPSLAGFTSRWYASGPGGRFVGPVYTAPPVLAAPEVPLTGQRRLHALAERLAVRPAGAAERAAVRAALLPPAA
jgi:hypothetical protein